MSKTILITGSTSGIGLAGAEALGHLGWRVLVHARTVERGTPVLERLKNAAPEGRFELVTGNLASLTSVRDLADQVRALAPQLDVLWNNAGGLVSQRTLSADGVELQMAVNHLAPFALTRLLLPQLQAAPAGRVVATSSMAHAFFSGPVNSWLASEGRYKSFATYGKSKLANILFIQELQRRHGGGSLSFHAFHPGWVATSFGGGAGPQKTSLTTVVSSWFALKPAQGADTGVFLASAPEVAAQSGLYWIKRKPARVAALATPANALALWNESEALVTRVLGG